MTRKIVLASGSKARRELLRQLGLAFSVAPSSVKESRNLGGGCAELVKSNALKKARDVSAKIRYKAGPGRDPGVVIGADTVVLVGKKIIGKPRSLKDARSTLRLLSARPQWVYTGLAVVDSKSGKEFVDYERTRVYMKRLSHREISNYFMRTSPLDKAGSFDIQGLGGIFIDRIEGCFYNVVGLPLAKLAALLKKAGIRIF